MTISPVALALPTLTLTDDEHNLVGEMLERLGRHEMKNALKEAYYEGKQRVRQLNIALPPSLSRIETIVGWAGTTVDVLGERLQWQGWKSYTGDDFGLSEVYDENSLAIDSSLGHTDALIYGTSFIVVGAGFPGEPTPLVTVESARNMTGIWDNRTRRLSAALAINAVENGNVSEVTLFTPNANLRLQHRSGRWIVIDRVQHNLGRVLVAQLVNNPRASHMSGKSEITPAIRYYVDSGVRTMLQMEINREFYSAPQRYLMGADDEMFRDENGNPLPAWQFLMTSMLVVPNDANTDSTPNVGQFTAASPQPYIDQIRELQKLVAGEAGMPVSYLGFSTENPTSADAIRAGESRLIKRAEQRQLMFGRAWKEAGRLALLVRDGEVPANFNEISVKWRNPATPTDSAAADAAVKLTAGDNPILPPDSSVTYDLLNLDPDQKRQLESEKRAANADNRLQAIRDAVAGITPPEAV